jgi:hypothetical protein
MSSFISGARRGKNKITEDRSLRSGTKSYQYIGAFAWGRKKGARIVWNLTFKN